MIETETIDKLFLELSQFTRATTGKELALRKPLEFAVANGADWSLEDWLNWLRFHAEPALTPHQESEKRDG